MELLIRRAHSTAQSDLSNCIVSKFKECCWVNIYGIRRQYTYDGAGFAFDMLLSVEKKSAFEAENEATYF